MHGKLLETTETDADEPESELILVAVVMDVVSVVVDVVSVVVDDVNAVELVEGEVVTEELDGEVVSGHSIIPTTK